MTMETSSTLQPKDLTAEQIRRRARGHILCHLGDFLWAGEAMLDATQNVWRVSVHSRALPDEEVVGHVEVDRTGVVVKATTRDEMQETLAQHRGAGHRPPPQRRSRPEDFVTGEPQLSAKEIALRTRPKRKRTRENLHQNAVEQPASAITGSDSDIIAAPLPEQSLATTSAWDGILKFALGGMVLGATIYAAGKAAAYALDHIEDISNFTIEELTKSGQKAHLEKDYQNACMYYFLALQATTLTNGHNLDLKTFATTNQVCADLLEDLPKVLDALGRHDDARKVETGDLDKILEISGT